MQMIVQSGPNNLTTPLMIHESHSLSSSASVKSTVYITISCRWSGHDYICSWIGHCSSVQEKIQDIRWYVHIDKQPCLISTFLKPI